MAWNASAYTCGILPYTSHTASVKVIDMIIIPAIDLKEGKCVRLSQGEMDLLPDSLSSFKETIRTVLSGYLYRDNHAATR